jgi:phenylalanyl-tRNA synthetase beta chain
MKVLYSQIRELVPGLTAGAKEAGEALTFTGFMMDSFTEVMYKGQPDYLLGLEVRQNRADCLSVIGVAREVAAYYGLSVALPAVASAEFGTEALPIRVETAQETKRVVAVKLEGLTNAPSPEWLQTYLEFYGLNSINLLVDLSNYVMLLTGYPSHLIDTDKMEGELSWALNTRFAKMTTLFGSEIELAENGTELVIQDEAKVIALAGIVGGREAAIGLETTSIIAEVAVYDRAVVRKNSRSLSVVTEASHRLEKDLDPEGALYALEMLMALVRDHASGKAGSALFDYYPHPAAAISITMKLSSPTRFAGIEIGEADILRIFKGLEFQVEREGDTLVVTPPTYRTDLAMMEDLVEEVVRIYGYGRIPSHETPCLEVVPNITPQNILVAEKSRDVLSTLGFDEILSWPLTRSGENARVNFADWNIIATQNSVNDVYPDLRQSMITGLLVQLEEYGKKNVEFIDIFEIGKVFGEKEGKYLQHEALGLLSVSGTSSLGAFKDRLESWLRLLGLTDIRYVAAGRKPQLANPDSCWDLLAGGEKVGILYKLVPQETKSNVYFAEADLEKLTALLLGAQENPVVEITQKLIALDTNVELGAEESVSVYVEELRRKFSPEEVWSIAVANAYPVDGKVRYTLRVTYMNLGDQEAKERHLKAFGL